MAKTDIKIHPTAMAFPTLDAKAMKELREDIKANGIRVPLLFNKAETMLIDGRNRWYCAMELGIPKKDLPIEHYFGEDDEIPSVIISRNLFRRHLNDKQRAALVTKLLAPAMEKEAKSRQRTHEAGAFTKDGKVEKKGERRTAAKIAKAAKVSRHAAEQTLKVRKAEGDEALDRIIAGKADLTKSAKKAGTKKRRAPKTLTFEEQVWRKWETFLNKWTPSEKRQVKELVAGWIKSGKQ